MPPIAKHASTGCPYAQIFNSDTDELSQETSSSAEEQHLKQARKAIELAKKSCPAFRTSPPKSSGKDTDSNPKSTGTQQNTAAISCPFRDARDAGDLRKKMLTVPQSHLENIPGSSESVTSGSDHAGDHFSDSNPKEAAMGLSSSFRLALEHVHSVSSALRHDFHPTELSDGNDTPQRRYSDDFMIEGGCPFKMIGEDGVPFVHAMEEYSLSAIMAQMADNDSARAEEATVKDFALSIKKAVAPQEEASAVAGAGIQSKSEDSIKAAKASSASSLSKALKSGTAVSHKAAENVSFVRNFIKGKIRLDLYKLLIRDLYFVYCTLEEELDKHAPDSQFQSLHRPTQLARKEALRKDMRYFYGENWENDVDMHPSAATKDYLDRIRYCGKNNPLLLLAHAYTRYLGDLSGGRVLQRVARKALQLPPDGEGLRFYEFENITVEEGGPKAFKKWYRTKLDNLDLSMLEIRMLVGEANVAFLLNMRMFEELDVASGEDGASVRPLEEALAYYDRAITGGIEGNKNEKCPFGFTGGKNPHEKKTKRNDPPAYEKKQVQKQEKGERCPWPFVFFHDPATGMRDYQTWAVLCAVCCWMYGSFLAKSDVS